MRNLIHFCGWILLAFSLLATTCERPVILDIEPPPARLVVSSSFTLGQLVKVEVSRSQSSLDNTPPTYLANARVLLLEGETIIEELILIVPPAERIPPYYSTVNFTPLTTTTYTIRVEANGFETVEAMSFIPESVPISKLDINNLTSQPDTLNNLQRFSYDIGVDFEDPEAETNYYHLNIFQEVFLFRLTEAGDTLIDDRNLLRANIGFNDNMVVADEMIGGVLLKDNPFERGLNLRLGISILPVEQFLGQVYVELRTVSEEYYLYYTTYSRQQNQAEGPFTDPVIIFNNIENGHGYFAGYNIAQDSVKLNF